jgi:thiol-disulfide isomerase/thioredoxin
MRFNELRHAEYKNPTLALLYGLHCAPCERLKPKLDEVCKKLGIRLEYFNASEEKDLCKELDIRTVPTVLAVFPDRSIKVVFKGVPSMPLDVLIRLAGIKA